MKYPFDTVKTFNKVSRIVSPLMGVNTYSVNIYTQNFITEVVNPDEICHSVCITIHHNSKIDLNVSLNNWTNPKETKNIIKSIKNFVQSVSID